MAGYRPRNRGNRAGFRPGPIVARRLRAADVNVSSAARKHTHDGIFVSAQHNHVSVHLVLGGYTDDAIRAEARNIAVIVTGWGLEPTTSEKRHDASGQLLAYVHFTYPEPEPAPEKPPAPPADPEWVRLQAGTVTSALIAAAGLFTSDGVTTTQESATSVTVSATGENADELLTRAEKALRQKRYTLERNDGSLTVRKTKPAKREKP
ncbi:hypothetical protein ACFQ6C_26605 [Streptomyces sp. NPDC056454]|uniref:hypothetical protein n=1 Tax=Streptomyces sp. NPDC056454 TaxID=3345823 RepID=UPI00367F3D7D